MKKIIACVLIYACLVSCIRNHENPNLIQAHAKFSDFKGNPINEAASGETLIITSDEFSRIAPGGLSPNIVKLYFDDVPIPFQVISPNSISTRIPIMLYSDYAQLRVNFRINQTVIQIIQLLNYRPTVTAEVLAGNDGTFQMPAEMTIDAAGNLYVIDQRTGHDVIMKVAPDGATSLFAGGKDEFGRLVGLGIDATTSRMYVSDATAQQVKWFDMSSTGIINVLAGSGTLGNVEGTGTGASFRFGLQRVDDFGGNEKGQGLVVDGSGNVYVGEQFGTLYSGSESQVRKITPAGVTSTVPGSQIVLSAGPDDFHPVSGLTLLKPSNEVVYTGGASSFFQGVTKVNSDATRTRIAGKVSNENLNDGTGAAAEFAYPKAISFYNPYYHVADGTNGAYRRVYSSGKVITLAGVGHFNTPSFCFCGITGPTDASYLFPSIFDANPNKFEEAASAIIMDQVGGIAVKSNTLLYLSDYGMNFKCIWKIRIE